jgi:hypothetical protein
MLMAASKAAILLIFFGFRDFFILCMTPAFI